MPSNALRHPWASPLLKLPRFYIQSAWNIPDSEKREQETFSLRHFGDSFRKVVVTGDPYEKPWTDRNGITFIGIVPFLLDPRSLETL